MTTTTVKNAHCVKLCRSLWELQQSGQLCDLSLRVGNDVITAHRTVLATSAAFFLRGKSAHADGNYTSTTINVSETTAASVQDIVRFVYTGVLTVNTENVDGIYSLCEKWNINSAKSLCEKFMTLHRHKSTEAHCERPNTRQFRNKSVSAAVVAAEQILPQLQCVEDNLSSEEALRLELDGKEAGSVEEAGGEPCTKRAKKQTVGPFTVQKGRIKGRPAGTNNKRGRGRPKKMVREQAEADEDTEDTEEVINDVPAVKWRLLRKCVKCCEQFESMEDLASHNSSCSASNAVRPYRIRKCRKCKRVFGSVEECRLHLEQCSEGAEEGMEETADVDTTTTTTTITTTTLRFRPKRVYRKCHRCHQVFDTPEELLMHKVECRTANIAKPYAIRKCRKCKKTFGTSEDCAVHQLECTASALKPPPEHFKYKCDNCSKAFTKKRTLDSHLLTKHWSGDTPGPEYFFCKIEGCKFKTLYPYYMQKHIHWTHAKDKAIMCDICGAMSKNEYYLKAHKRIRHSEAEVFDCDVCGMKIRTQQSLKMHRIRVHGVEQPTKLCSHCTYITYTKSELDRHMFQKHDTPFPSGKAMLTCPYCDYKTITKSVIDEHVLRHTADKRQFPCDQCRKRFITERDLRSHLQVHNPERKRYKCPHCDYSTPYGQYKLRTHVETMHEKKDYKPWVCKICNYRTNIKGNLTLHLKNTHKLRVETKTRMINKVDQLCSTGSEPGKAGTPSPEAPDRPGEPAAAQTVRLQQSPAEQVASLLPEQVSMLVEQRPEEHLERQQQKKEQQQQQHQQQQQQHQQLQHHHQQQQQQQQQKKQQQLQQQQVAEHAPQLPYCETPALLSLTLPTERVAFKHMTSTTEETKLYKLHPVSDVPTMGLEGCASISNRALEQLSLHTMVPAGGGHLCAGHHHQGNAELDFNMAPPPPPRMLGPTDVSGAQTMYMDTLINSLVSRSDHLL